MFLVLVQLLLFHSCFLIFVKQFLIPMNAKGDRVVTHVHDHTWVAVRWCVAVCFSLTPCVPCCGGFHPSETENRREDLHVIVCPSRVALGILSSIKCGSLLARHRLCKSNRNSGFGFGSSRLA